MDSKVGNEMLPPVGVGMPFSSALRAAVTSVGSAMVILMNVRDFSD